MTELQTEAKRSRFLDIFAGEYGMLTVLILLCVLFSLLTIKEGASEGAEGGRDLAGHILTNLGRDATVFIAARKTESDKAFAEALETQLAGAGVTVAGKALGSPRDIKLGVVAVGEPIDVIACVAEIEKQPVFNSLVGEGKPAKQLMTPPKFNGSVFLSAANLRNVAARISVIAILAIGMTMIIITAGIDLSVGSLIALSAVVATYCIREFGGTGDPENGIEAATNLELWLAALIAILICGIAGAFTGWMVVGFCVPPFIATLAMMQVLRGTSYKIANNESITDIPDAFEWIGNGLSFGVPNSVILMLLLYVIAHIMMSKTKLGRYIYATGGNPEAARLSGVPVKRIKLFVYTAGGILAGLGGVVEASRLDAGAGNFGMGYELTVIAAVVVGGTSLFGGKGKIFGTLIGAFIIAVIENGMNLINLGGETQMIVLGSVILAAVILERFRSGEWKSAIGG